eukprot:SAG11_NODE_6605_length_1280_cov_2.082981_1_plen_264_part_00
MYYWTQPTNNDVIELLEQLAEPSKTTLTAISASIETAEPTVVSEVARIEPVGLATPDADARNPEEQRLVTQEHNIYRLKETDHIDRASSQKFDVIACGIRDEGHALFEEKKEQRHQLQRLQQAQKALESQIVYSIGRLQTAKAVRTATVAKILTEVNKAVQEINDRCELRIATDWDTCRAASEELIAQSREIIGDDQHTLALLHVQRVHLPGDQLFSSEYCQKQTEPQPPPPATGSELAGAVDAAIADIGISLGDDEALISFR